MYLNWLINTSGSTCPFQVAEETFYLYNSGNDWHKFFNIRQKVRISWDK